MWTIQTRDNTPPPGPDGKPRGMPDEAVAAVIAEVKGNIEKIRTRGGDVAFVRYPYDGLYLAVEDKARRLRWTPVVGIP